MLILTPFTRPDPLLFVINLELCDLRVVLAEDFPADSTVVPPEEKVELLLALKATLCLLIRDPMRFVVQVCGLLVDHMISACLTRIDHLDACALWCICLVRMLRLATECSNCLRSWTIDRVVNSITTED